MESNFKNVSPEPSLPKYLQLKQILSNLINEEKRNFTGYDNSSNKYLLPTESKLTHKYNLSRGTVRKALDELEKEGLIYTEQGRGTFAKISQSPTAVRTCTKTIGLLSQLPNEERLLDNDWASAFINCLNYYVQKFEYNLIMYSYNILKGKDFKELIDSKPVDGLIIIHPMAIGITISKILRDNFTCVLMQNIPDDESFYSINIDYARATRLAMNHLLENGHRNIANIRAIQPGNLAAKIRPETYVKVLMNNKIEPNPELVRSVDNEKSGYDAMISLLNEREAGRLNFTAVYIDDQEIAKAAIKAIKNKNIKIPDDISVIVYNDAPMFKYNDPPITCTEEPLKRWALSLVRNLILRIEGKEVKLKDRYLKPELIVRSSVSKIN